MQNKSNKLPYVFVEIDEIEEQDALDPYGQDAAVMGYHPSPGAPFPPNLSGPMFPQIANPYAPPIGPLAALQMTPQFQVGPYAESLEMLDVDPEDDYLEDDYDIDYLDDEGPEGDPGHEEVDKVSKNAPSEESLNLETVVIPVFKNAESPKAKAQSAAFAQGVYPQVPILPTMPFFQTLPYAYNPFRTPFVNPMWAMQPRVPGMGAVDPARMGSYPMGAQTSTQQRNQIYADPRSHGPQEGSRPRGPMQVSHSQSMAQTGRSHMQTNRPQGANGVVPDTLRGGQQRRSPDSPILPMEALEALEGASSPEVPLPSHAAQNIKAASSRANVASNVLDPVRVDALNRASNEQTITASTDNVSVSVSVVQPKQAQAGTMDMGPARPEPKPQPQGQAVAVEQPSQNAALTGVPSTTGPKAKKKAAAPKAPKETFEEMAMRENAEKTHTSLAESDGVDQMGKPLLDMNAIETSDMFSTPAASMNDSMTGFQFRASRRKHVFMIVLTALILAAVIAAVVCVVAVWSGAATIAFDESNVPSIQLAEPFQPK